MYSHQSIPSRSLKSGSLSKSSPGLLDNPSDPPLRADDGE